jgi:uncharacterized protein YcbK (DUF882 family)
MEIKLTKNFTLDEMCRSRAARKLQIKNTPSPKEVARLQTLCEKVLQPLRDYMGEPIIINSGYRSPALNRAVGGANGSQHVKGEAADIRCVTKEYAVRVVAFVMMQLEFDQLILERKKGTYWVHVSYTTDYKNRQQYKEIIK